MPAVARGLRKRSELKGRTPRDGCKAFEEYFAGKGYRCLWEQKVPYVGTITAYYLGRSIILIQQFDSGGWEAFAPVTTSGEIADTLREIDAVAFRVTGS